ncbi:MAG: hypothetical protein Q9165_005443 [Trypethelium subeluteriae]
MSTHTRKPLVGLSFFVAFLPCLIDAVDIPPNAIPPSPTLLITSGQPPIGVGGGANLDASATVYGAPPPPSTTLPTAALSTPSANAPSPSTVSPLYASIDTISPVAIAVTPPDPSISSPSLPSGPAPSGSVPPPSVPSLSAPSTSIPSASVPSASVPSASVPSASVPSAAVLSASIPTVSTPAASIPTTSVSFVSPSAAQVTSSNSASVPPTLSIASFDTNVVKTASAPTLGIPSGPPSSTIASQAAAASACEDSYFAYSLSNLRESGAIKAYKDWVQKRGLKTNDPYSIKQYVSEKLNSSDTGLPTGDDGYPTRPNCTDIYSRLASDGKTKIQEARQVYFLLSTVHRFSKFVTTVTEAQQSAISLWEKRAPVLANTLISQQVNSLINQCPDIKDSSQDFINATSIGIKTHSDTELGFSFADDQDPATKLANAAAIANILTIRTGDSVNKVASTGTCKFPQIKEPDVDPTKKPLASPGDPQKGTPQKVAYLIDSLDLESYSKDAKSKAAAALLKLGDQKDGLLQYRDFVQAVYRQLVANLAAGFTGELWSAQSVFVRCAPQKDKILGSVPKSYDGTITFYGYGEDLLCQAQNRVPGVGTLPFALSNTAELVSGDSAEIWSGGKELGGGLVRPSANPFTDLARIPRLSVFLRDAQPGDEATQKLKYGESLVGQLPERFVQLPVLVSQSERELSDDTEIESDTKVDSNTRVGKNGKSIIPRIFRGIV